MLFEKKCIIFQMAKVPSSARLEHDLMEANLDRPKTPEARFMSKDIQDVVSPVVPPIRFPFFSNFAGKLQLHVNSFSKDFRKKNLLSYICYIL